MLNKAPKLLRGGTVLIHGEHDHVCPRLADILIEEDRISKIEPSILAPTGCHVIDCTDKIISPGFVDTHHHVWQSPLKGFFGDTALFPYLRICSLGVDCHSATGSSMVNEMRVALQTARGIDSKVHIQKGLWPRGITYTTSDAFNMGTIQGAVPYAWSMTLVASK